MGKRNGRRPSRPESGEQPQKKVIAVNTEVVRRAHDTTCHPTEDGGLVIEHVVQAEGEYQLHRYIVGEEGKARIREASAESRIVVPDAPPVPADLQGQGGAGQ